MASENFERDQPSEKDKSYVRMRSIMDVGMGIMWSAMGVFLIFVQKFSTGLELRYDATTLKAFGAVCLLYGIFRIYRGFKKNYLKER